ncbi:hypothetical protein BDB13_6198 [Rhodococcus sp. OK302]|nr:hypothetical protein BDB13_6198 [Rhodococcus sp. OK302]
MDSYSTWFGQLAPAVAAAVTWLASLGFFGGN